MPSLPRECSCSYYPDVRAAARPREGLRRPRQSLPSSRCRARRIRSRKEPLLRSGQARRSIPKVRKAVLTREVSQPKLSMLEGKVLLPRGAKVELVILETKEKSGVKGASLQLGLRSVTVEGNTYLVISEERKETSRLGNQSSNGADRRRWSSTWHANRSCRRWRWWRRSGWTDRGGRRSGSSSSHAGERGSHPGGVCSSFPVG